VLGVSDRMDIVCGDSDRMGIVCGDSGQNGYRVWGSVTVDIVCGDCVTEWISCVGIVTERLS
jgi:hypothetical protein